MESHSKGGQWKVTSLDDGNYRAEIKTQMTDAYGPGSSKQQSSLKTESPSRSSNTLKALLLFKTQSPFRQPSRMKTTSPVRMPSPSKALSLLKRSPPSKRLSPNRNTSPFKKPQSPKRPDLLKRQIPSSQRRKAAKTSEPVKGSESPSKLETEKKTSPRMKLFLQWRHLKRKLVKKPEPAPPPEMARAARHSPEEYLVPVDAEISIDSFPSFSSSPPVWATLPHIVHETDVRTAKQAESPEENRYWPYASVTKSFLCPMPIIMAPTPPDSDCSAFDERPPPGLVLHPDCPKKRSPSTCPSPTKSSTSTRKSLTSTTEIESLHITADDSTWLDKRLEVPRAFVVVTPPPGLTLHPDTTRKPSPPRRPRSPQNLSDPRSERRARQRAQDVADGYFWPEDSAPVIKVSPPLPDPSTVPDSPQRQSSVSDPDDCSSSKSRSPSIDSQASPLISPLPCRSALHLQSDATQLRDETTKRDLNEERGKNAPFGQAPSSIIQISAVAGGERTPKYMLVRHSVYEYIDGKANCVEWQSVLDCHSETRCRIVVPILQSTGLYVAGFETRENHLSIESFGYQDRVHRKFCEVVSVSRNYLYAVDPARGVRCLANQGGRRLMDPIWENVPDEFDEVFNITQNDNLRYVVYGRVRGQNTIKFIDNGPPLLIHNFTRLDGCLDIVHIPFTKTIYFVWRGHIEVREVEVAESLGDPVPNVHFLPRRTRVEKVLHPFSDSRGLVIYARNTWSNKQAIISYNLSTSRWKLLVNFDLPQVGHDDDDVTTDGHIENKE